MPIRPKKVTACAGLFLCLRLQVIWASRCGGRSKVLGEMRKRSEESARAGLMTPTELRRLSSAGKQPRALPSPLAAAEASFFAPKMEFHSSARTLPPTTERASGRDGAKMFAADDEIRTGRQKPDQTGVQHA